jgi:hypothetical protein
MYKATREDAKSPSVGDEFEFVREVDLSKVFEAAMYRGKKLSEFFAAAALAGEDGLQKLKNVFQLSLDEEGKPVKKVTPFNYFEVLKPKTSKDLKIFLSNATVGEDEAEEKGKTEDVPF